MTKKNRELGNDTYFTIYNSDLKLIKDPVKKVLYSKIKNWIYRNEDKNKKSHFKNGHWWTYGTYEYWAEECGLEIGTVGIHLRQLVKSGILINDNHNRMKSDKTYWYRLATNEELKQVNFRLLFYGMSKYKNADNPNKTSINKYTHAPVFPIIALYANKKYNKAWIGLKSFHHIFPPNTSAPVCRDPVRKI